MLPIKKEKPIVNASRETEEDIEESLWEFIQAQVSKFYLDHIPVDSIKDLPNTCEPLLPSASHPWSLSITLLTECLCLHCCH
eukprot:scaffold2062_cov181-Ochromonas_danica.AAC.3